VLWTAASQRVATLMRLGVLVSELCIGGVLLLRVFYAYWPSTW